MKCIKKYKTLAPSLKKNFRVDKRDSFKAGIYNEKTKKMEYKWVYISPRRGKTELEYARELARAEIAYGSDPLDVIGLTGRKKFFGHLYNSLFKVQLANGKQVT